jgi:integrase/recombinase XerD
VSELCHLRLDDVDLTNRTLTITLGKGMSSRSIEPEKKGVAAIRSWLAVRPNVADDHLFLNYHGEPIGERGIKKLVFKYRTQAGITKKVGCHSLRHTFATHKAKQGVSPFVLMGWLGHANLTTTQIYVHMAKQDSKKVMEATSL